SIRGRNAVSLTVPFGTLEQTIASLPALPAPKRQALPAAGDADTLDLVIPLTVSTDDLGGWVALSVEGRRIRIQLPADLADGEALRVRNQGRDQPDGTRGDLIVTVTVSGAAANPTTNTGKDNRDADPTGCPAHPSGSSRHRDDDKDDW